MRCLTLADLMRRTGAKINFVCREHTGNMCDLIESAGFEVQRLPKQANPPLVTGEPHARWLGATWEEDAEQTQSAVRRLAPQVDWLIVDHYALDRRWETAGRSIASGLMVIDDLADRLHECDILLDHNFYPELRSRYDLLIPRNCLKLLGPEFALLRPEFLAARSELGRRTSRVERILVSFGNSDLPRATLLALQLIDAVCESTIQVDIVIGAMCGFIVELQSLCARHPRWTIHGPNNQMAQLMTRADLAFGGGGVTTWERCCVGLPCLIMALAINQIAISEAAQMAKVALYLGESTKIDVNAAAAQLRRLMNEPALVADMSARGANLVDGRGAARACAVLTGIS